MVDAEFQYTYEYQGNAPKLVHTPLTDKCYLTLTQGLTVDHMALFPGPRPFWLHEEKSRLSCDRNWRGPGNRTDTIFSSDDFRHFCCYGNNGSTVCHTERLVFKFATHNNVMVVMTSQSTYIGAYEGLMHWRNLLCNSLISIIPIQIVCKFVRSYLPIALHFLHKPFCMVNRRYVHVQCQS